MWACRRAKRNRDTPFCGAANSAVDARSAPERAANYRRKAVQFIRRPFARFGDVGGRSVKSFSRLFESAAAGMGMEMSAGGPGMASRRSKLIFSS
jgi:hypothetical protein